VAVVAAAALEPLLKRMAGNRWSGDTLTGLPMQG
jgi:hypothetical protein